MQYDIKGVSYKWTKRLQVSFNLIKADLYSVNVCYLMGKCDQYNQLIFSFRIFNDNIKILLIIYLF